MSLGELRSFPKALRLLKKSSLYRFSSQALQGADLLAQATDALVIEPDYFPKGALKPELYANKTEENQAAIQDWWGEYGDFKNHIPTTDAVLKAARDDGAEKIGIVGFCFGRLVVDLGQILSTQPA